jgi:hypothetical protein
MAAGPDSGIAVDCAHPHADHVWVQVALGINVAAALPAEEFVPAVVGPECSKQLHPFGYFEGTGCGFGAGGEGGPSASLAAAAMTVVRFTERLGNLEANRSA